MCLQPDGNISKNPFTNMSTISSEQGAIESRLMSNSRVIFFCAISHNTYLKKGFKPTLICKQFFALSQQSEIKRVDRL